MNAERNTLLAESVAVVGGGYWGKNLVRNFSALNSLAAVCDTDENTLRTLQTQYPSCRTISSFSDVLCDDSVRAVAISSPAETHAALVRDALMAGKDVFVEKPLCLSVDQGTQLVELARRNGRILMVGHLLWYHPAIVKLKELVQAGELGRIQYIYSNRLNLGKIRREENILWSFAPHDISVILGLLNEMPETVQAQGGNYLHQQIADVTVSMLSFPSGVKAHVFVSWLHPFKEQKLVVVGDRRMAVFNDLEKKDKLVLYPHSIDWKNNVPMASRADAQVIEIDAYEPLREECSHFLDCVRRRTRPRTDGEEGLRVLTVLQRCQEALARIDGSAGTVRPVSEKSYFVHESAFVDDGVTIGQGTSIWHASHVLKGSSIGKNCKIGQNVVIGPNVMIGESVKLQNNVSVYEGVTLEDYVFCGPSMVFTNVFNPRSEIPRMKELKPTLVRRGATLGANCTIICGNTIGQYAFIGAGAVVTKDVPDYALMIGNPARLAGWMCRCGEKLTQKGVRAVCKACGLRYRKERSGMRPA
ncbi:MAG: Gfo/Idh/MocA family oxidoreductase [Nitrospiraceae bacterium]